MAVRLPVGGEAPSLAMVLTLTVLVYYLIVEFAIGLALGAVFALLLWAADRIADLGTSPALAVFAAAFVGGWVVQLIGHRAEGNRPALLTSLFQAVISPVYLMVFPVTDPTAILHQHPRAADQAAVRESCPLGLP